MLILTSSYINFVLNGNTHRFFQRLKNHVRGLMICNSSCRAVNMFTFEIGDVNQLKGVMRALTKVQGVVSVERI